jgi:hypothetical protein
MSMTPEDDWKEDDVGNIPVVAPCSDTAPPQGLGKLVI